MRAPLGMTDGKGRRTRKSTLSDNRGRDFRHASCGLAANVETPETAFGRPRPNLNPVSAAEFWDMIRIRGRGQNQGEGSKSYVAPRHGSRRPSRAVKRLLRGIMRRSTSRVRKNQFPYEKSFRTLIKLASFRLDSHLADSLARSAFSAPLVFSSPPLGAITERAIRLRKAFFRSLLGRLMMGRTFSGRIEYQVADLSGRLEQSYFHCLCVMRIAKTPARIDHHQSCFTAGCAVELIDGVHRGSLHANAGEQCDRFAAQAAFHYCFTGAGG